MFVLCVPAIDMLNSGLLPQSDLEKYIAVAIKTVEMKDPTHSRSLRDVWMYWFRCFALMSIIFNIDRLQFTV